IGEGVAVVDEPLCAQQNGGVVGVVVAVERLSGRFGGGEEGGLDEADAGPDVAVDCGSGGVGEVLSPVCSLRLSAGSGQVVGELVWEPSPLKGGRVSPDKLATVD